MATPEALSPALEGLLRSESASLRATAHAVPLGIDDALSAGASLRGKVVVITGAASGFGRGYAKKAAELGLEAVQVVVDEIAASGGKATGIACDVTNWDAQVAMFRHARNTFGHIDVVAVNAGIAEPPSARYLDMKKGADGEPSKPTLPTASVNIVGAAYTTKLAFFHLNENPAKEDKAIVILGSMASFFGLPGAPVYSASKHAMLGLFRSLYYDAQIYGIRLNIVNPFFVSTGIFGTLPKLLLAGIPLPTVDDVVAAMVAASSKADSTGSAFVVDFKGILEVPWGSFAHGEDGYYAVFSNRAKGAISFGKWAFDTISALVGAFRGK
ncbi:hypothetical protein JCM10449v2_002505 [Rhodotorula kratochvilovae]